MPAPARPARVEIGDLETGESLSALYNPDKVEETLAVSFTKLVVPGLSHKILQFTNTDNLVVQLDLGFDGLATGRTPADGADMRAFLHSLCYQRTDATTVATGSPPQCLLYWPNLYSLVCRVTALKISHTYFDATMASCLFVATVTLEEDPQERLFSEDVRRAGTVRAG